MCYVLCAAVGVIISDVFTLPSGKKKEIAGAKASAIGASSCDEECTNLNCNSSINKASFWVYPMWLKLTLSLLITHLVTMCMQYILLLI